jgi:hypothetical protein
VSGLDIRELLGQPSPNAPGRVATRSRDVAEARKREQMHRNGLTQSRALRALSRLHPDEYKELYRQAKEWVADERGPLPGDETAA